MADNFPPVSSSGSLSSLDESNGSNQSSSINLLAEVASHLTKVEVDEKSSASISPQPEDQSTADTSGMDQRLKRKRTGPEQKRRLTEVYNTVTITPSSGLRQQLATELNMTPREIQVWFQNRRAKYARMNKTQRSKVPVYAHPAMAPLVSPPTAAPSKPSDAVPPKPGATTAEAPKAMSYPMPAFWPFPGGFPFIPGPGMSPANMVMMPSPNPGAPGAPPFMMMFPGPHVPMQPSAAPADSSSTPSSTLASPLNRLTLDGKKEGQVNNSQTAPLPVQGVPPMPMQGQMPFMMIPVARMPIMPTAMTSPKNGWQSIAPKVPIPRLQPSMATSPKAEIKPLPTTKRKRAIAPATAQSEYSLTNSSASAGASEAGPSMRPRLTRLSVSKEQPSEASSSASAQSSREAAITIRLRASDSSV